MGSYDEGEDAGREIILSLDRVSLEADLGGPRDPRGVVIFAHGSGSSRKSTRNRFVARQLEGRGLATLLFDLLTPDEDVIDRQTADFRFDIGLLAGRLMGVVDWVSRDEELGSLGIGLFGASTGAAAALIVAAEAPTMIGAIVSRGGRVDLADAAVQGVLAPTLLIVGQLDLEVIALNRRVLEGLPIKDKRLTVIDGAGHLFEEPGALEQVARHAGDWFLKHL